MLVWYVDVILKMLIMDYANTVAVAVVKLIKWIKQIWKFYTKRKKLYKNHYYLNVYSSKFIVCNAM